MLRCIPWSNIITYPAAATAYPIAIKYYSISGISKLEV